MVFLLKGYYSFSIPIRKPAGEHHGKIVPEKRKRSADRAAVYKTATKILCNLGYEKASIRNIAEAMGMTKAGLYYYFESKEELLYQILDSYMDDLLEGIQKTSGERISDPLSFIHECIRFQVNLCTIGIHTEAN